MKRKDVLALAASLKAHIDGMKPGMGFVLPDFVQRTHNAYVDLVAKGIEDMPMSETEFNKAAGRMPFLVIAARTC